MQVTRFSIGAICALLILTASPAEAFEWPTEERLVISTFGELRDGGYLKGIEMAGENLSVQPVLPGKVVFYRREAQRQGILPGGLGQSVVVQHERGIRTRYGNLRDLNVEQFSGGEVGTDFILGYTGASAENSIPTADDSTRAAEKSFPEGLFFQLIDGELQRIVNPLLSLSSIPDTTAPRIVGLYVSEGAEMRRIRDGGSLPQGDFAVIVETYDMSRAAGKTRRLLPYAVRLIVNGEEIAGMEFDAVEAEEQRHVLVSGGRRSAEDVYSGQWRLRIGNVPFRPTEMQLQVVVSDFSGNEVSERYRIRVEE